MLKIKDAIDLKELEKIICLKKENQVLKKALELIITESIEYEQDLIEEGVIEGSLFTEEGFNEMLKLVINKTIKEAESILEEETKNELLCKTKCLKDNRKRN